MADPDRWKTGDADLDRGFAQGWDIDEFSAGRPQDGGLVPAPARRRKRLAAGHQALLAFRPDRQETRAGRHQARADTDGSQSACSLQTVPVVFGRQSAIIAQSLTR